MGIRVSAPCVTSPGPRLKEQPLLGTQYSRSRGKEQIGGRNSDSEPLLGHDILHVHSYAVGQH